MKKALKIIDYNPQYKKQFKAFNIEWLTNMFVVEPYDLEVLSNPKKYILSKGGGIWLIQDEKTDLVVGTAALIMHEPGCYELTKMAVSKKFRGFGLGRKLLKFLIEKALEKDYKSLFLLTNTECEAAIHLYREEGFVDSEKIKNQYGSSYKRCNLGMLYKKSLLMKCKN